MGDFAEAFGFIGTFFWKLGFYNDDARSSTTHRQLEDNAFATLRTSHGQVAQFHTSWTQWKNRFLFEVVGSEGYVRIDGLGGSYGVETLTVGHRRPESGPPLEEQFVFPGPDLSWQAEWQEFVTALQTGRQPIASGENSLQTMKLLAAIYESSLSGQVVKL
jgi:predicted dehydrogenase